MADNPLCLELQNRWTALENARVILERAKQLATDRVAAARIYVEAARQSGDMMQIMAAQANLMACIQLEQQAVDDLARNTQEECEVAVAAFDNGCTLVSG